ncbi:glycosyltransferase family 39 protein [Streptomyces sp. Go40/10]|uniref:ArnT family glycosyltransferase n=1 Tax=Streptomyces sp. Go40/10 TaxID=2825844 RepID=UPI001E5F3C1E|nr:glycosyltransferase family 39 protein [Streptomyces sp. Go40/10]UFR02317.1 glycosyltransferase family 39 protein [Streptomyces sp. Go40/10]
MTSGHGPVTAAEGLVPAAEGLVPVAEAPGPGAEGAVAGFGGRAYRGDGPYDPESTLRLRVLPARGRPEPAPGYTFDEITRADWALGPVPDTGWSAAPGARRTWVSRALLACLLLVQAMLSLRLHNTAFEDEALYVYAGHAMIDHLFHGTPDYGGFGTYFSGSPVLYPVLAAWVDSVGGLTAVRLMSLGFMLAATGLLYSFTRMLFNERTALCAAGIFAVSQSTLFLGNFATYDALAILLLALSAWILVRVVRVIRVIRVVQGVQGVQGAKVTRGIRLARGHWALPLAAAPVAALAVGVKYASALYLPTVTILLVLAAHRRLGGRQALRLGAVFTGGVVVLLGIGLATTDYLQAIRSTTTDRAHGTTSVPAMAWDCFRWGGLLFALACLGTVLYTRRERLGEVPGRRAPAGPGTRWRLVLGAVLTGTALLAPAYQIHLQTSVSLHKHIGYGLLFAAPMAGVGLTRLMGAHFRFPQAAIAVGVLALTLGMSQSAQNYGIWPSTTYLMPELAKNVRPGQKWLGQPHEAPVYYLSREGLTDYTLWTSIYYIDYTGRQGRHLMGAEGYRAAIDDGWFDGVVLDWSDQPGDVQALIRGEMRTSGRYRLAGALSYRTSVGTGHFEIWLRVPAAHGR